MPASCVGTSLNGLDVSGIFVAETSYQVEHHAAAGGIEARHLPPGPAQDEERRLQEMTDRERMREAYRRASLATRESLAKELEKLDPLVGEGLEER